MNALSPDHRQPLARQPIPSGSRLARWWVALLAVPLPSVLLFIYFFQSGALFKPTLAFVFFRENPYLSTALIALTEVALAMIAIALRLGRYQRQNWPWSWSLWAAFLLLGWAGLSLAWSPTPKAFESLAYWIQRTAEIVLVVELSTMIGAARMADLAVWALECGLLLMTGLGLLFALNGWFNELETLDYKNTYGMGGSLLVLIALHRWSEIGYAFNRPRTWISLMELAAAAALLGVFVSKTSLGCLAAALAVQFALARTGAWTRITAAVLIAGGVVLAVWDPVSATIEKYVNDPYYVSTLSERTVLWEYTYGLIAQSPLIGHGLDSFRFLIPNIFSGTVINQSHNEWLMLWAQLGLPGLLLVGYLYFSLGRESVARLRDPGEMGGVARLSLAFLMFYLVHSITEADPLFTQYPLDVVVLFLVIFRRDQEVLT